MFWSSFGYMYVVGNKYYLKVKCLELIFLYILVNYFDILIFNKLFWKGIKLFKVVEYLDFV